MNEDKVVVSKFEYRELVSRSERIKALKRLFDSNEYVSMKEVKAVLDLPGGEENGKLR